MSEERYYKIILYLQDKPVEEKIRYLEENIEETDFERNGYNDELCDLLKKLKGL